ncbi:MAG: DMT family transporter [Cytophagales bacterium]|nr:DMT family transporter [Cytophagales bacterium]
MLKDYLHLHFIVFIWGFTAVLGVLISIPAVEAVFYRTLIAAVTLGLWVCASKRLSFRLKKRDAMKMLGTGMIIGAHWMFFFAAAEVANASVCLAGSATCALWTSLLEPLLTGKKLRFTEVFLGMVVIVGLYVIFLFQFNHALGLAFGIMAAVLAAVFTIFNSKLSKGYHHLVITFYEMVGACLAVVLFFPVYAHFFAEGQTLRLVPGGMDWIYLSVLALLCTVYAYSASVELMKRISAFAMNLSVNLEPVYGMLLAVYFLNEDKDMNEGFYLGTLMILVSVVAYPLVIHFQKMKRKQKYVKA